MRGKPPGWRRAPSAPRARAGRRNLGVTHPLHSDKHTLARRHMHAHAFYFTRTRERKQTPPSLCRVATHTHKHTEEGQKSDKHIVFASDTNTGCDGPAYAFRFAFASLWRRCRMPQHATHTHTHSLRSLRAKCTPARGEQGGPLQGDRSGRGTDADERHAAGKRPGAADGRRETPRHGRTAAGAIRSRGNCAKW